MLKMLLLSEKYREELPRGAVNFDLQNSDEFAVPPDGEGWTPLEILCVSEKSDLPLYQVIKIFREKVRLLLRTKKSQKEEFKMGGWLLKSNGERVFERYEDHEGKMMLAFYCRTIWKRSK